MKKLWEINHIFFNKFVLNQQNTLDNYVKLEVQLQLLNGWKVKF
jgi:hypothetical protein